MRQRLGIGTALIGDPGVLILDEPANGLDPGGIRWMRDLLRDFANRGGTVLLSSHLLHEIEVVADDIVVIGNGRIVAQGTKAELLHTAGTLVRATDLDRLGRVLAGSGIVATAAGDGSLRTDADARPGRRGRPGRRRAAHRAAQRRRRRARGDVPRAHRGHPTRRSSSMSALAVENVPQARAVPRPVPMTRVVSVELRKMFDTRSGFWLMASIVIASLLATGAVIAFAPDSELTYSTFATAIGFPMAVILPMIALLSVTSEWSQRSGLTTFTLVPHRGRVIGAKLVCAVSVGVVSMLVAFAVGALGNLLGTAVTGTPRVWDATPTDLAYIVLGNVLGLLIGFMLGVLVRNSSGAIVAYFVYSLVLPPLTGLLAATQGWFRDLQPWVDFSFAQGALFNGAMTGTEWAHLAVAGTIWLLAPLTAGLVLVMRSEVK